MRAGSSQSEWPPAASRVMRPHQSDEQEAPGTAGVQLLTQRNTSDLCSGKEEQPGPQSVWRTPNC